MKYLLLPALLLSAAAPLLAQDSSAPTITITTPSINTGTNVLLTGTATDTGSGTGENASSAGVQQVLYQVEGSSKWRKAQLTSKGSAETTWVVSVKIKGASGKRYYFRAVDTSGNESDVVGRRFRRGT